ncbi:hypothetical protein BGZ80_010870 [Entomortierella chlamydospora]|uniref:Cation diffusion facilitator 1 n=1 Tax=Entomortierella chlamydospora TaxID=101097 RepID=A0A9P6MUD6_9FUNG|nr:hypothetical protein BGZ80_010870 [Entomortierella chlamydospora]
MASSLRANSPSSSHRSLSHSISIDLDNGSGVSGSPHHISRSHTPHANNAQNLLSIDTGASVSPNLPSPEPSPDFYTSRDPMSLASKRMSEEQIRAIHSSKKVKEFYREQNELITDLLDPPEGREGAAELEEKNQVKLKIAIYGSVAVNVLLFLLQLYAAISSKSLSLFATMADSFMDLLSGVILMYAARASTKSNWFKYPSIESIRTLVGGDEKPPMPGVLAIVFVSFALEQIQLIVGKTADPAFLKKLTYIALTHHPKILQVDTCTAYHAGNNLFVEVDVVMAPETPLIESHDISEGLQIKLESLPNVERAFVHVDYETSHAPEHRKLK